MAGLLALLAGASLLGAMSRVDAQDTTPPSGDRVMTVESVMAPLQRSIAWYQDTRVAMQSIRGVLDGDLDRGGESRPRGARRPPPRGPRSSGSWPPRATGSSSAGFSSNS
jgi:hypothetical protein